MNNFKELAQQLSQILRKLNADLQGLSEFFKFDQTITEVSLISWNPRSENFELTVVSEELRGLCMISPEELNAFMSQGDSCAIDLFVNNLVCDKPRVPGDILCKSCLVEIDSGTI